MTELTKSLIQQLKSIGMSEERTISVVGGIVQTEKEQKDLLAVLEQNPEITWEEALVVAADIGGLLD